MLVVIVYVMKAKYFWAHAFETKLEYWLLGLNHTFN